MDGQKKFLKGFSATGLSVILLSTTFVFVGIAASIAASNAAHAEMIDSRDNGKDTMQMMNGTQNAMDNNNKNNNSSMMADMRGHHLVKGQISSIQPDADGNPAWIQSGIWVARIGVGENGTLESAQVIARFGMVKPDGTAVHSHSIYGFKPTEFTTEQNNTVHVLKGMATVTMKDGPVMDVPLTIKVFNKTVIGFWIGPDKVDGHFGSSPVYGTVSMGSRTMMMEMGSMMMSEKNPNANGTAAAG